jgi:hypothetical protein
MRGSRLKAARNCSGQTDVCTILKHVKASRTIELDHLLAQQGSYSTESAARRLHMMLYVLRYNDVDMIMTCYLLHPSIPVTCGGREGLLHGSSELPV